MTESLSTWHQNRRKRICQVNIKVNLIVWLVEFSGCMTLAIDFLFVGSRNNVITGILGNLSLICFFILLPLTFLINCSSGVNKVADNSWIDAFSKNFNSNPIKEENRPSSDPETTARGSVNNRTPSLNIQNEGRCEEGGPKNNMSSKPNMKQNSCPSVFVITKEAWT